MINKKILVFILLLMPFLGIAQGMNFEHITLEEALTKAKAENKLVFIDFYTVWCGPCKKMARDIFPLSTVGEMYNKNFINLKLDAEKEGEAVAKQYNVTGYPTLLYLDTDGKVLLMDTAYKPEDVFLDMAERAISSINSEYSLENLQDMFVDKQNDEQFLKMYIKKMDEFGQDISVGVDAWLKVQTEIDESSPKMLKYLLKNSRNILIGGKGEQILDENYETFMKQASSFEAKMLPRIKTQILNGTFDTAVRNKDPELMQTYIEAYKSQPEDRIREDYLVEAELIYFDMLDDDPSYKATTANYINMLITKTSIEDIHQEDKKSYEMYKKAYDRDPKPERVSMLNASKEGLKASKLLKEIDEKGKGYLKRVTSNSEYKDVKVWIKYGYELKADNCFTDDLKAEMYYKKGKTKKAIQLKERAIKNWPTSDKKFVNKAYELEQMKKGASI
ncbi:thioredoxin domain-containing protein [Aestuariibaculum sp. M13]|uniref:thioredoxin family protein n=1 Tax=Aestuariibaculum sp. M13 TaxID=2967132 RepID=UPI002159FB47|nr:thioredoxin domain-containing protein [Aestuariibaculum sp. M13]MCR8666550.1 thioredoxin domain-containing protein [Aestuariibaculum sp. M13]